MVTSLQRSCFTPKKGGCRLFAKVDDRSKGFDGGMGDAGRRGTGGGWVDPSIYIKKRGERLS